MRIKSIAYFSIIISIMIMTSCSTNITDWEKKELTWEELPNEVQITMINAKESRKAKEGGTTLMKKNYEITSLDEGISANYKWIHSGGGTGYHRLIINNNKYDLHSPARGNKQNEPYVLFNQKLYYTITLNVDKAEELKTANFGFFDFRNEY